MIQAFAFYLFAAIVIASGVMTIGSRNPVHSVLWLILAFFNAAGLFLTLGAEFIAMLLVIVYVGAVAVLFLFVVMMLDVDFAELRAGFARYWPFATIVGIALLIEIGFALAAWELGALLPARLAPTAKNVPNIEALGEVLYTRYLYVFEGAGLILLVAMIGAIVLTHRRRGDVRAQRATRQISRRPGEAVLKVDPGIGKGVEI
ncbi:MAG TPA: NADH-quinone oxidoreductase subunit J [Allosphingosinicella sp.]|nr:NADH-quinone oxidoreductase subunit J [Allosphingosinicella sp.]